MAGLADNIAASPADRHKAFLDMLSPFVFASEPPRPELPETVAAENTIATQKCSYEH
jgi:hypothetical protein